MAWGLVDYVRVAELDMGRLEARIFWTVASFVNADDNIARVGPTEIAKQLGTSRQAVSRTMTELKRRRILFQVERNQWRVNPWLSYRGSVVDWEAITPLEQEPVLA